MSMAGKRPIETASAGQSAKDISAHPAERDYALEVVRVSKDFASFRALDDVTVRVRKGQFLTILGQSGSGKTTLLRIISGLEQPTYAAGLRIGGHDALNIPPHRRNVTTIFQHFALFPHMSVGENIEYGLKLRKVDPQTRRRRAHDVLELVRLPDMYDRRVHQLSGGERQRVALARSIIVEPDVLLLDEAISALDEGLRAAMQLELVSLQRRLGLTFIYITHSQEEALTMSDRIVLLQKGRVAQEGAPRDLFERPSSRSVAAFMGTENIFDGTVESVGVNGIVSITLGGEKLTGVWTGVDLPSVGDAASAVVRAEKVRPVSNGSAAIHGHLRGRVYKGKYLDTVVETALGNITLRGGDEILSDELSIGWDAADLKIVPKK